MSYLSDRWPGVLVTIGMVCAIAGLALQLLFYGAIVEPAMA